MQTFAVQGEDAYAYLGQTYINRSMKRISPPDMSNFWGAREVWGLGVRKGRVDESEKTEISSGKVRST